MTWADYEKLILRLEELARRHPSAYKWRVGLLAALGYGYILLVLAVLVGLALLFLALLVAGGVVGGVLWFLIPTVILIATILRALWVPFDPPMGLALSPETAPGLFATVEKLQRRLKTPRIHEIVMTGEFNASVVQTPAWACSVGTRIRWSSGYR
ncbi:MAG TPA: hypothetical protein VLB32_01895 [Candidatus Acidoferrales bacterium]|nr:hypothetical protein [Candidatus Acidoferrales bacterium]